VPNIYEILASLDAARRTARRNIGDMVNDPRGYAEKMLGHMQNQNAGVAPVAAGGQLTNRPLTLAERADQAINSVDFGGGLGKIAYHGSPHKFDRFNAAKMGTGEGAQAYGKGMYLAEAPEVADQYRINLSYDPAKMKIGGQQINDYYNSLVRRAERARDPDDLYDKAGIIERLMGNDPVDSVGSWAKSLGVGDWFEKEIRPNFESFGHLYKTDIPDQAVEKFLDWDKPLHQQHPDVQAAVKGLGLAPVEVDQSAVEAAKARFNQTKARDDLEEMHRLMNYGRQPMGSELVRGSFLKGLTDANGVVMSPEQALASKGIPGIRYLDSGSRDSAGVGTSNFVAFDPDIIRILERNGEATGAAPWTPEEYAAYLRSKGR
jgi:hypothetical protein